MKMILTHEGWTQDRGRFCDKYAFDTSRSDHEIHWKNGKISKQETPFKYVTADWNCDGDVYEECGANFEGYYSGRAWLTPGQLLQLVISGDATVPGIEKL